MRPSSSFFPGWPFLLVAVGVCAGAAPAIIESLQWKPPPLSVDERGQATAACRGEVYEGDRRVATLEDARALRKVTCLRGSLTIGTDTCSDSGKVETQVILTTLKGLKNLEVVTGSLRVQGLGGMSEIKELSHLTSVGTLSICNASEVRSMHFPALQALGNVAVSRSGLEVLSAPQVQQLDKLEVDSIALKQLVFAPHLEAKSVIVGSPRASTEGVSTAWLAALETVGTLSFRAQGLKTIEATSVTSLGTLEVPSSDALEEIRFPLLTSLRSVGLHAKNLRSLQMPMLAGRVEQVYIEGAESLRDIQLGQVEAISRFHLRRSGMEVIDLPALTTIGDLIVESNPHLRELKLPKLTTVKGSVKSNPYLGPEQRKLPPTVRICDNAEQPPCQWDEPFQLHPQLQMMSRVVSDGLKLQVRNQDANEIQTITSLGKSFGFHRGVEYAVTHMPFSWFAVELDARGAPRAVAILSERPTEGSQSFLRLPKNYVNYVVMESYPRYGLIAQVDTGKNGPFVVDVYKGERGAIALVGRINLTEAALDRRALLHGLSGVRMRAEEPVVVAFATDPTDFAYPNLPIVFQWRGGVFEPDMKMQNAKQVAREAQH
jgi:hypothetical protein